MKVKIEAGAEFHTVTPKEMEQLLQGWHAELARGVKFRHVLIPVAFANPWTYTPGQPGIDMPDSGMAWKVKNVAMSGGGFTAGTDTFSYFLGEVTPSRIIASGVTRQDRPDIVLNPNEGLAFSGAATGTGGMAISLMVVEVPYNLAGGVLA